MKHWGVIPESELPPAQRGDDYRSHVYRDFPFRLRNEVRETATKNARWTARSMKTAVFLIIAVPVGIELVSLGVDWLGHVLSAVSIGSGALIVGRTMGWLKPSRRAALKAEEENRMRHYFYHCERNPAGFARLKQENVQMETVSRNRAEAIRLRAGDRESHDRPDRPDR